MRRKGGALADWERQRDHGGGRKNMSRLVRVQVFEWWSDIRWSIDYKKAGARFPVELLKAKWKELLQAYAADCLIQNIRPTIKSDITSKDIQSFEKEFNLTLRKPNRRFKVAREVLQSVWSLAGLAYLASESCAFWSGDTIQKWKTLTRARTTGTKLAVRISER